MSFIRETATYANQECPSGTGYRENGPGDQPRKDQSHESQLEKIKLKDEELEDVQSFTYFGTIATSDGGADEDVKSRIGKARQAFNTLSPMWNSTSISTKSKLRIFTTNVKSVLLHGSETFRVTRSISKKL